MNKKIHVIFIVLLFSLVFYGSGFAVSISDYALIQEPIWRDPVIWKLTKSVAEQYLGGQLFINNESTAQGYFIQSTDTGLDVRSIASFHLDGGWNRIMFQECLANWIRGYGLRGSGDNDFLWPVKLDCIAPCYYGDFTSYVYYIYVADASNDRIVELKYRWFAPGWPGYQIITWNRSITGNGLDLPQDLDINDGGTFYPHNDDYLWVLNGHELKRFTLDTTGVVLRNTYGTYGCDQGQGHFCRPTAIACGRNPFASQVGSNNNDIYVADAGNGRLVWLRKSASGEMISWLKEVPLGGIVDLEVDNSGQVWAVDSYLGRIYKFTFDLYPLCWFQNNVGAGGQFNSPSSFSYTGGYLDAGNVYISESWTDNSGGQFFAFGTDLLDFEITSSMDYSLHYINYTLIDQSDMSIKIYNQDNQLIKTLYDDIELSGPCAHVWNGTNQSGQQVSIGDYRVVATDSSLYFDIETGERVNGVVKEAWVHHVEPMGDAPWNLVANQTGPDKVTLEWEYWSNKISDQFTIYCDGCLCGTTWGIGGGVYTDSGLVNNRNYVYWVREYQGGYESPPSNADTVTLTSLVLTPSVSSIFPLEQNSPELPLESKLPVDTANLEIIYRSVYPGHSAEIEVKLKSTLPICGFNFLIKPQDNTNLLTFQTNSISQDSILINSNWLHYPVREGVIDTMGSLISRWNSLSCRGQVGDTSSPYNYCEYLWIKGWAPPNRCINPNPNYQTLFKFGVDAFCIPDSVTDRSVSFSLPFGRLYSPDGEEIPFKYHAGQFMTWYSVPGDANGDSLLNVGDITFLINYLFKQGPRPCIPEAADGNGSCVAEVGDITTLINYLYKHGPAPVPGCWYGK